MAAYTKMENVEVARMLYFSFFKLSSYFICNFGKVYKSVFYIYRDQAKDLCI